VDFISVPRRHLMKVRGQHRTVFQKYERLLRGIEVKHSATETRGLVCTHWAREATMTITKRVTLHNAFQVKVLDSASRRRVALSPDLILNYEESNGLRVLRTDVSTPSLH
jgi:hypothetical protein